MPMLTENDVVEAISSYLRGQGCHIVQQRTADQRGTDLIAECPGEIWHVEAKGSTSSKRNSSRFGLPFDTNQINSHVSRAIYTAMKILGQQPDGNRTRVALGLPNNDGHRRMVKPVQEALNLLGIAIFWVSDNRSRNVTLEDPHRN